MSKTATISVVLPAYRAANTIERAIRSALNQTHPPLEIVVVDDCSPDNTAEVVRGIADERVRLITVPKNMGAGSARNLGCSHARGDWLAFLDADDEWFPEKTAAQLAVVSGPSVVMVGCDAILTGGDGRERRFFDDCPHHEGPNAWRSLLQRNFLPTPTVMLRRSTFEAIDGFDPNLVIGEDLDVWIRAAERGEVAIAQQPLARIHWRADSLMRTSENGELRFVLPMIRGHVKRLASRLSRSDGRGIIGQLSFDIGYRCLRAGNAKDALRLFIESGMRGHRPLKSLLNVLRSVTGIVVARA